MNQIKEWNTPNYITNLHNFGFRFNNFIHSDRILHFASQSAGIYHSINNYKITKMYHILSKHSVEFFHHIELHSLFLVEMSHFVPFQDIRYKYWLFLLKTDSI